MSANQAKKAPKASVGMDAYRKTVPAALPISLGICVETSTQVTARSTAAQSSRAMMGFLFLRISSIARAARVTATLTQEQTLACPVGGGFVQVRAYKDGQAIATGMVPVEVAPVIYNEVLHA